MGTFLERRTGKGSYGHRAKKTPTGANATIIFYRHASSCRKRPCTHAYPKGHAYGDRPVRATQCRQIERAEQAITNQQTSIVSAVAGTTADPVDKPMELLPLGPVLFIDTAGIDDDQETVGELRTQRTKKVFDRCDMGVIVTEAGTWGPYEEEIASQLSKRSIPFIIVCNKTDLLPVGAQGSNSDSSCSAESRTPRGTVVAPQQEALIATAEHPSRDLQQKPLVCMCATKREGVT